MVTWLFSGQGAQKVGMAFDLPHGLFERASKILGYDLYKICNAGPAEELDRTDTSQAAIMVTSLAALEVFRTKTQIPPNAVAGLSLGEYTALVAAHSLLFEDALRLVKARGEAMHAACNMSPGGMASVLELERGTISAICAKTGVQIANLNAPGQIVISGEKKKLEAAIEECKKAGARRVIPLRVAGAYHSELMRPAQLKLEAALKSVKFDKPKMPIYSNVTARPYKDVEEIRRTLAVQIVSPVRWEDTIQNIADDSYIEFGPGGVLAGLVKKIFPNAEAVAVQTAADAVEAACKSA